MTTLSTPSDLVTSQRHTLAGIACGMGAGALWGLVFLAPELAREFSPLALTVGRYLFYGLIAAALIAPKWRTLVARLPRRQWWNLMWLSLAGNTVYFVLLSSAVQTGGIAMTSLVVGMLPVTVALVGSRARGAVSLRKLMPSLLLCAAGIVCIGWQSMAGQGRQTASGGTWLGLLCAEGALASWSAFAVGNSHCLRKLEHVSAHDWSLLTGLVTGAQSLLLVPLALALEPSSHDAAQWTRFLAVSASVAVLASILGNALWNRMSRLLPLTLAGQMIVFETVFALIYAFLWEHRLPAALELVALTLVLLGVVSCLAAHRRPVEISPEP
jgi:drug/metabolite transporter (DMT)-like permease